jgi:hypothetical protein
MPLKCNRHIGIHFALHIRVYKSEMLANIDDNLCKSNKMQQYVHEIVMNNSHLNVQDNAYENHSRSY